MTGEIVLVGSEINDDNDYMMDVLQKILNDYFLELGDERLEAVRADTEFMLSVFNDPSEMVGYVVSSLRELYDEIHGWGGNPDESEEDKQKRLTIADEWVGTILVDYGLMENDILEGEAL